MGKNKICQSIGVISILKKIILLLISIGMLNNSTIIQDSNEKSINVLGASYEQELNSDLDVNLLQLMKTALQTQTELVADATMAVAATPEPTATPTATVTPTATAKATAKATTKATTTTKTTASTSTTNSTTTSSYYLKTYKITYFCGCSKCNPGNAGRTASGKALQVGMVAMKGVPFGTIVEINGTKYVVEDRCASDSVIDIYVTSHSEALQKGTFTAQVKIYK